MQGTDAQKMLVTDMASNVFRLFGQTLIELRVFHWLKIMSIAKLFENWGLKYN